MTVKFISFLIVSF